MKDITKAMLSAVAALGVAASAQAQYVIGDLLVGFTGGANDFIYDLGPYTSLTLGETWSVGASRGSQFGVIGAQSTGSHIYATSFDPAENAFDPTGLFANARANITTIAGGLTVGLSRATTPADTTGWTYQTAQPAGTPGNTFQNNFLDPNVSIGATAYFYDNANNGTVTPLSVFTYDSGSGVLSYTAVPEPISLMFASMGLLAVALGRRLVRKA
jgi:hypothetical protein